MTTKRAIVVSFNWKTQEILYTTFAGAGCAQKAENWKAKDSFIWRDFPEEDGWTHFMHWTKEAGEERGEAFVRELLGEAKS